MHKKEVDMRIVVLDGYTLNPGDLSWENLEALGELTVYDRTKDEQIVERIGDAEIVYTNKTPITKETLSKCPNVKFIGVLATGYNIVDIRGAKELGVIVCNVPAYSTETVAQHTMGLLLELCSHIGLHSDSVKKGEWTESVDFCYWKTPLVELSGKTIGIIGYGKIGQATAKIAKAFGMKVLAYANHIKSERDNDVCEFASLETIYSESDVISLHCPLYKGTEGIINSDSISKMKDGVYIVNTARGGLIVEEDLRNALESGKVGGAAVDVVSTEPIKEDNPLLGAKNIIITPHIAWAAKNARERLLDKAVRNLEAFMFGKPINVVNS